MISFPMVPACTNYMSASPDGSLIEGETKKSKKETTSKTDQWKVKLAFSNDFSVLILSQQELSSREILFRRCHLRLASKRFLSMTLGACSCGDEGQQHNCT